VTSRLLNLIPELQELVDAGIDIGKKENKKLSATVAYGVWAKLSQADQDRLFKEIGKDKIAEMSQKETGE
jgi:hypothetical protein